MTAKAKKQAIKAVYNFIVTGKDGKPVELTHITLTRRDESATDALSYHVNTAMEWAKGAKVTMSDDRTVHITLKVDGVTTETVISVLDPEMAQCQHCGAAGGAKNVWCPVCTRIVEVDDSKWDSDKALAAVLGSASSEHAEDEPEEKDVTEDNVTPQTGTRAKK